MLGFLGGEFVGGGEEGGDGGDGDGGAEKTEEGMDGVS